MNLPTPVHRRGCAVWALYPGALLVLGLAWSEPVFAQEPVDFAILGCTFRDGPTPDTIELLFQVGVLTPETGGWEIPIDIYFNGQPYELTHTLTMEKNFLQACQQTFPNCDLPNPCGFTKWTYKGGAPFTDNWRCLANFNTNACDCVDPGPPVAHKILPRPSIDSFFDVFVDLADLVPESNNDNNRCRVFYAGPLPTLPRSWGLIKAQYFR